MIGKNILNAFSLYFHIPFCTRKCDYCHFYVLPDKESLHDKLLEALIWEWEINLPLIQDKKLMSIYFGGGTPSLFGPHRIQRLLELIKNSKIELASDLEITLEANPEKINLALMQAYKKAGINRVSIGIQSLDTEILKSLGRLHDAEMAKTAVLTVAEAGISNITIDLMYELPGQTLAHWEKTLNQIQSLPITHLSLYNLTIEPHTIFFKKRKALALLVPDAETSLEMYQLALKILEKQGLHQYEISAFCKPDYFSRHNVGYWTGRPFLGLGPSAFSFWNGQRFRNVANLSKYHAALKTGQSPVDFREELDPEAKRRELFVIHLRLTEGVNLKDFQNRHGLLDKETLACLDLLCEKCLVEKNDDHVRLTSTGILYHDAIAAELI